MAVNILQTDREFILGIIGFPNIELADTGLMTDAIIDAQVILPSLQEYFRWFPIEEIVQTQMSSGNTGIVIDFPEDTIDQFVYDVKDVRLAQLQDTTNVYNGSNISNPLVQFRNISKGGGGGLGSRMDYGFSSIRGSEQFGMDAYTNQNQVFYNNVDTINKTVTLYSQNPGIVQTTFAKYSDNVNYVKYTSKREFLDLCRGELLLYWANNLKRINPEFPVQFNVDDLVSDGQELKDLTIKKWQGKTKAVVMRN
ncbi:MAG: hypothetical protein PF569_08255 [Candidatus Woesearchaeota archaeon]|jgi:hypothetical protein|nr:hypothetical protein [Candidatus Woesearchaeota archaeon]